MHSCFPIFLFPFFFLDVFLGAFENEKGLWTYGELEALDFADDLRARREESNGLGVEVTQVEFLLCDVVHNGSRALEQYPTGGLRRISGLWLKMGWVLALNWCL